MASNEPLDEELLWIYKGKEFYSFGNFENAEMAFKKVLSINPQNMDALILMGKSLILQLNFDNGIDAFDKALQIDPNSTDAKKFKDLALDKRTLLRMVGDSLDNILSKGRPEHLSPISPSERDKLVFQHLKNFPSFENSGYKIEKNKKIPYRKWDYSELLRSDPQLYKLRHNLTNGKQKSISAVKVFFDNGLLYEFLGYHNEAIRSLDDGLKFFPEDETAWNNKAVALGKNGEIDKATKILEKIISLHPQKNECIFNLCFFLNQSEKYDEMGVLCDTVLNLHPDNKKAKEIKEIRTKIDASGNFIFNNNINEEDEKNKSWWQFWK